MEGLAPLAAGAPPRPAAAELVHLLPHGRPPAGAVADAALAAALGALAPLGGVGPAGAVATVEVTTFEVVEPNPFAPGNPEPVPFERLVEVRATAPPGADPLPPLAGVAAALARAGVGGVGAGEAAAVLARVPVAYGWPSDLQYLYRMRARPGMTTEGYQRYWREVHVGHVASLRTVDVVGYRQLHVDVAATARCAEGAGLATWPCDGMTRVSLRPGSEVRVGPSPRPAVGRAMDDNDRFIDPASAVGVVLAASARRTA